MAQRHFGMDLVRALAIVTVLAGHSLVFFHTHFKVAPLIYLAVFGVELFFALSGFLIGRILLEMGDRGLGPGPIRVFWLKRWFRTIPAYLFVVIATILFTGTFNWSQFLFLQNFFPEQMENFPASWSLTVEEWFYLLFPLGMLLLSALPYLRSRPGKVIVWTSLLWILLPWVWRFLVGLDADVIWDMGVRKQIPLRLDAIAYGVLLSVWHYRRPNDLLHRPIHRMMGILGLAGFVFCWWYFNRYINVFTTRAGLMNAAFFYPAINITCVAITAFFVHFRIRPDRKVSKFITLISLTSYSLYLIHFQTFNAFSANVNSLGSSLFWLMVAVLTMSVAGGALYKWVEKPFMNMRSRFDPGDTVSPHLGKK